MLLFRALGCFPWPSVKRVINKTTRMTFTVCFTDLSKLELKSLIWNCSSHSVLGHGWLLFLEHFQKLKVYCREPCLFHWWTSLFKIFFLKMTPDLPCSDSMSPRSLLLFADDSASVFRLRSADTLGSLFPQDRTDPSVSSCGLSGFWAAQHHNLSPLSGLKVITVPWKCGAHNLCCLLSLLKYTLLNIFRVCEVLWKPGHNG